MTERSLVNLFVRKAQEAGAQAVVVQDVQEFQRVISEVFQEPGLVYCPGVSEKEKAAQIAASQKARNCRESTTTIEEAFGGIADTGTIVCSSSSSRFLEASLLPEHHVAIVPRDRIFQQFSDFFASVSTLPTYLTLITGPSRTADIEKTLVIGMHGPKRVTVIVW